MRVQLSSQSGIGLLQVVIYSSLLCVVSMAMIASLLHFISLENKTSTYTDADVTKILLLQVLNNPDLCKNAMKTGNGSALTIKRNSTLPLPLSYITDSTAATGGTAPHKVLEADKELKGAAWKNISLTQIFAAGTAPASGTDTFSANLNVTAEVGTVNGSPMIGGSKTVDWNILLSITADASTGAIQSCTLLPSMVFASSPTPSKPGLGNWVECGDGRFGQTAPVSGIDCNDVCGMTGRTCLYRGSQAGYNACSPTPTFPSGTCADNFSLGWSSQCVCN